ncbi:hypothetical protein LB504_001898 [Fusarium proliferatum]|nr:hypothetical protein LB504_001898 [Fusarium proliferatum]
MNRWFRSLRRDVMIARIFEAEVLVEKRGTDPRLSLGLDARDFGGGRSHADEFAKTVGVNN